MPQANIVVYGAHWCPDCRRSKQFLGEHQIPYTWLDIEEDKQAEQEVIAKNQGKRIIPTIVFEDGDYLVEPTNAQLAAKLGLKTRAGHHHYDLIVVGGGPAESRTVVPSYRTAPPSSTATRATAGHVTMTGTFTVTGA